MLTLDLSNFAVEFKDGALKHVGASNTSATAKLYDVTEAEARAFGDERVKLVLADDEGNQVEVALFEAETEQLRSDLETVVEADAVFE